MKPMLAFRYDKYPQRVTFPSDVQPKLDGVRLLYRNGVFQTRSARGDVVKTLRKGRLSHLHRALTLLPRNILLDGEAYIHGVSRQRINGLVSVNSDNDGEESSLLQYHVFDAINPQEIFAPFEERWGFLSFIWSDHESLRLVKTTRVLDAEQGDREYADARASGYEGLMYRDPRAPYGFVENCGNQQNRWHYIHKRKHRQDAEAICTDIIYGEGKYANLVGSLLLRLRNGIYFSAGSGLSDNQREEYVKNPPLGHTVTFEYDILSDDGTPIQPVIKLVHDD